MAATTPNTINLEPFDPDKGPWSDWQERLESAFRLHKIAEDLKVDGLLNCLGSTAYSSLKNRLVPKKPCSESYATCTKVLQDFYEPKPNKIAENFKLWTRKQEEGENIQSFITALQKCLINCKLGDFASTTIRNAFVFGLRNKRIQSRLLETQDLTLERAIEIATTMELSEAETSRLQGEAIAAAIQTTKRSPYKDKSKHTKKVASRNNTNSERASGQNITCFRCGKHHYASVCTMQRNIKCLSCGKSGHIKKVCKLKTLKYNKPENQTLDILAAEHTEFRKTIYSTLNVNGRNVQFEVDSGASVTLMSLDNARLLFKGETVFKMDLKLVAANQTPIQLYGYITVKVRSDESVCELNMYLTVQPREPLLGREWMLQLREFKSILKSLGQIQSVSTMSKSSRVQELLKDFPKLADPSISKVSNIQARLNVKANITPVFLRPRSVPFRLRAKVEEELDKLVNAGIFERVDCADWATPIVPVIKKDGSVRICGDYSVTLNPNLKIDAHPLPTPDELLTQMAGGIIFSKIDLTQAYLQLEVGPQDREYLTLNTHKGLYRSTRLMYGIASAPAIWQRTIENILKDITGVVVFLDDIRIAGSSSKDHMEKLRTVFTRLQKYNIRINLQKSEFCTDQIQYCGYIINSKGINKAPEKIEAIKEIRKPNNITELRSFLDMIHYYDRFIPKLSSTLQPLNKLLQKNVVFKWSTACEKSFQEAKRAFVSPRCLAHFDPTLPITLATDASPYGVDAVLSHIFPDGSERAIQFASQTLSKTQQSYSQIDKEAYAIIFGIKKFYQFLQGSKFTLITDRSSSTYANIITYERKSEQHANADCLSRLPIPSTGQCDAIDVLQNTTFETLPVTATQVVEATGKDKELAKLREFLKTGSGSFKNNKFYTVPLSEFSLLNNVIFRGHRIVVPAPLQKKILHELHTGHFGIVRMKLLARSYVWWNKIDYDIEQLAQNCFDCNSFKNNPVKVSNHIWEPAQNSFERVHVDFAGPFLGHYFFILIDAYTKWPKIHLVKDITTRTTINLCSQIFYTYGLPQYFVSDNARTFTSNEFAKFLKSLGITHKFTAPYHPATNGQAERYVQILKNSLKRMRTTNANAYVDLQELLFQYRNTPHVATGFSPAEFLFSRKIRTRFDLLRPSSTQHTTCNTFPFKFTVGKRVSCRDYTGKTKWLFGNIVEQIGELHFKIRLDDGRVWKRHVNQVRPIGEDTPRDSNSESDYDYFDYDPPRNSSNENIRNENNTDNNANDIRNTVSKDISDRTIVNASPSGTSTPRESTPSTSGPSYSSLTSPEADSSLYSTPTAPSRTSTPKPSPPPKPESSKATPTSARPLRSTKVPLHLRDYILFK
ncbi:PREDICTED: uncharacterized protein K02A2.6-like [Vollenhovia emeryi]|uniref:uncharacterized protein K02A2.6-like n=1 Tax=Vollenhovia emeryi TaxID=411798 RepID=UPI0005F53249|nr:PREDICTED: uncharacterized protein K02A2.6-like [Vollenhovia emeryi]